MPHSAASELGQHCVHNTPKWVFGLKRIKVHSNAKKAFSAQSARICLRTKIKKDVKKNAFFPCSHEKEKNTEFCLKNNTGIFRIMLEIIMVRFKLIKK